LATRINQTLCSDTGEFTMKTIIFYESEETKIPVAILAYDENKLTNGDICEHVFTMLEIVSEQSGFKITTDLYEISEEITEA
jgi:hypothetical protein